jgi:ABC-type bacteriocin/lantibiotic exporter with double-glycine peptidase domain
MDVDGIYRQPSENSISIQVIHLIEQSFEKEILALKQTAEKIRNNLRQNSNSLTELTLDRFRNEFNLDLRILLASQIRIKEIHVRLIPYDNGGSYSIKYFRKKNSLTNIIDHESINDDIIQQDHILQTFTVSNIRETLSNDPQRILTTNGWWLGPVICEKNKNEAYIMAHILPLRNEYEKNQ